MPKEILSLKNVEKSFGDTMVLKDISLEVTQGEVVSIIGSSGGGKSTLLRCATLLETFERGYLAYEDIVVAKPGPDGRAVYADKATLKKARAKFGLVFQNFNLFPHRTVLQNVMDAPVRVQKVDKEQARAMAVELLEKFGLAGKEDMVPNELSGGQLQRVAIARALINSPAVLLADEPSGNLDTKNKEEIHKLFFTLRDTLGQTVVIVTHDEQLARMSDREIMMVDGWIRP